MNQHMIKCMAILVVLICYYTLYFITYTDELKLNLFDHAFDVNDASLYISSVIVKHHCDQIEITLEKLSCEIQ